MRVGVRIRPLKNSEIKSESKFGGKSSQSNLHRILHVTDGNLIFDPVEAKKGFYYQGKKQFHRDITIVNKNLSFRFDDVFDEEAQNRDVFEKLMKPLVHSLMDGFNCSFINYGASGTGKSHTILGNSTQRGIAYLTMEYVFFQLNKRNSNEWIYEVSVSYLEVYNEKVINLLAKSRPLTVTQRGNGDANISGLSMRKVNNLSEVQKLLVLGNRNRTKHFCNVNTHSNQSNTIFQVHINAPPKSFNGDNRDSTVKLLLVELGGSERNSTEGTRPNTTDTANICKPILTLKNCLHRLADGSRNIPFNDSQLTKILRNSFEDNCLTVMLFNVSPSTTDYSDTYNTLTYANKTKQIGKSSEKQNVAVPLVKQIAPKDKNATSLIRTTSYTISTTIHEEANKSIYTESKRKVKSSKSRNDQHSEEFESSSDNNVDLTELTRWYYEIATIYDVAKTAVEGFCKSVSKEKLMELRLRCREDVENCRSLLLSGGSNRMARVRVKSLLEQITKQVNIVPNKVNYWKSRLQICQQQLQNLHRKVKESNLDHILESYLTMKEFEVNATKAHLESMHIMKLNAIYVNKTEIYGYLSVLDVRSDMMIHEPYNELQSLELTEIGEIDLPLYKNCLAGSSSKTNSQTKCNKVDSRTSMNIIADIIARK